MDKLDDCSSSAPRAQRARTLAGELRRIEDLERQILISRARVKTLTAEILAEGEPDPRADEHPGRVLPTRADKVPHPSPLLPGCTLMEDAASFSEA